MFANKDDPASVVAARTFHAEQITQWVEEARARLPPTPWQDQGRTGGSSSGSSRVVGRDHPGDAGAGVLLAIGRRGGLGSGADVAK